MMYSFYDDDYRLQVIETHYDESCEVYNFLNAFNDDETHSHIHYDSDGKKYIYRSLDNPSCCEHYFYNKEKMADEAIKVSTFYFPFESKKDDLLSNLSVEQLQELKKYLECTQQEQKRIVFNR